MTESDTRPTHLTFLTSNAGKLREFQAVMAGVSDLTITNRGDVEIDEIQGTIEEIARHKAGTGAIMTGQAVLTEDTALEFKALNGLPGPYINERIVVSRNPMRGTAKECSKVNTEKQFPPAILFGVFVDALYLSVLLLIDHKSRSLPRLAAVGGDFASPVKQDSPSQLTPRRFTFVATL
ncbi:nucleoside triphosphate pyrophosphohydrolase ham1 [Lithohypha guttulata]|uniref:nucleoside triphosphate pyrophosphohydrolase ham1 n=1 Tax=Lithohypha guttulata TaxID=1690604 RepID=UPI002DDE479F|nr:nucleoside triphosphate pyrophosphohydrolase ham1 [Lithohypha guttulata]